jgi:hypothetical protein
MYVDAMLLPKSRHVAVDIQIVTDDGDAIKMAVA